MSVQAVSGNQQHVQGHHHVHRNQAQNTQPKAEAAQPKVETPVPKEGGKGQKVNILA